MPAQFPASMLRQDSDSRPYWEGLARGELRIQHCDTCGRNVFYPRSLCPHCHADTLSWIVASGKGTIYSYTVVHQAFGSFAEETPFVVAIVELEEGVRMMSNIIDAPRERVAIGLPVQVIFEAAGEDLTLPYFLLVS